CDMSAHHADNRLRIVRGSSRRRRPDPGLRHLRILFSSRLRHAPARPTLLDPRNWQGFVRLGLICFVPGADYRFWCVKYRVGQCLGGSTSRGWCSRASRTTSTRNVSMSFIGLMGLLDLKNFGETLRTLVSGRRWATILGRSTPHRWPRTRLLKPPSFGSLIYCRAIRP